MAALERVDDDFGESEVAGLAGVGERADHLGPTVHHNIVVLSHGNLVLTGGVDAGDGRRVVTEIRAVAGGDGFGDRVGADRHGDRPGRPTVADTGRLGGAAVDIQVEPARISGGNELLAQFQRACLPDVGDGDDVLALSDRHGAVLRRVRRLVRRVRRLGDGAAGPGRDAADNMLLASFQRDGPRLGTAVPGERELLVGVSEASLREHLADHQ